MARHKTKEPPIRRMEDSDAPVEMSQVHKSEHHAAQSSHSEGGAIEVKRVGVRMVIVVSPKIKNPTKALGELGIRMNLDAVKLVKEARENL